MAVPLNLGRLSGRLVGTNRLWLDPDAPPRESPASAVLAEVARGTYLSLSYTWEMDGEPQEGLMLVGRQADSDAANSVWIDSFHAADKPLVSTGSVRADGVIEVVGSYEAPPGPDWRWRTTIEDTDGGSIRVVMYNVSPEGREDLAVEMALARA